MSKKIIKFLFILAILICTGYGIYQLYHLAIEDATMRIRKGVTKGISDTINPLKWPKKIFG